MRAFGRLVWFGLAAVVLALPFLYSSAVFLDLGGIPRPRPTDPTQFDVFIEDAPFLYGVHDSEPAVYTTAGTATFRWLEPQASFTVPLLASSAAVMQLRMLPPPNPTTPLTLTVDFAQVRVLLTPEPRVVNVFVPINSAQGFVVDTAAPAFYAPGDARELAVALDYVYVTPNQAAWRFPWLLWLFSLLLVGCWAVLGLLLELAWPWWAAAVTGLMLALGYGWLWHRELVLLGVQRWLVLSAVSLAVVLVWQLLARWRWPHVRMLGSQLLALTLVGWSLRMAGLWHPQMNNSDVQLHVNNLVELLRGGIFFSEGLPPEAGGGRSPYPPLVYVLMLPFLLIWHDPATLSMLVLGVVVALDALVIPLLWWAVYRADSQFHQRWAWWSAALYLLPLTILRSLTIGELTNSGGQAVGVAVFLALIRWVHADLPRQRLPLLLGLLLLASLAHVGVFAALLISGGLWLVLEMVNHQWRTVRLLAVLASCAGFGAALLYYSVFVNEPTLAAAPDLVIPQFSLATKFTALAQTSILAWNADVWWPWWLAAGAGLLHLATAARAWFRPLVAWLATSVVASLSLLWSGQTIRWWLWVMPALCLAAGVYLAARKHQWLAWLIWAVLQVAGLWWWVRFVLEYRTGTFIN